jgi:hypothetical protein
MRHVASAARRRRLGEPRFDAVRREGSEASSGARAARDRVYQPYISSARQQAAARVAAAGGDNGPDSRRWCGALCRGLVGLAAAAAALACLLLLTSDPQRAAHGALPEPLQPFRPLPIRVINALRVAAAGALGVDLVPLDAE